MRIYLDQDPTVIMSDIEMAINSEIKTREYDSLDRLYDNVGYIIERAFREFFLHIKSEDEIDDIILKDQ